MFGCGCRPVMYFITSPLLYVARSGTATMLEFNIGQYISSRVLLYRRSVNHDNHYMIRKKLFNNKLPRPQKIPRLKLHLGLFNQMGTFLKTGHMWCVLQPFNMFKGLMRTLKVDVVHKCLL